MEDNLLDLEEELPQETCPGDAASSTVIDQHTPIPSAVISRPRYPCDDIAMNHMTSFRISYNMISC